MSAEYRPIAEFDGYVVNRDSVVWSVGRTVNTKGGATRTTAAKPIKPDKQNRVALRRDGKTYKVRVDQLAADPPFPPRWHYGLGRIVTLRCRRCSREWWDELVFHCENAQPIWPDWWRCPDCLTAVTNLSAAPHFPFPGDPW